MICTKNFHIPNNQKIENLNLIILINETESQKEHRKSNRIKTRGYNRRAKKNGHKLSTNNSTFFPNHTPIFKNKPVALF